MFSPTVDIAIVDETDDALGMAFARWALQRGVNVARWRFAEAALIWTIAVDGSSATIEPALPLLLRPIRGVVPPALADDRFVWGERFAALWSAAALSSKPVINRPDEHGWAARSTISAVVTDGRAGLQTTAAESFWRGLPPGDAYCLHQDIRTWAVVEEASDIDLGRSRALDPMRGWDQVIVVGSNAFRATAPGVHDAPIERRSIAVVDSLGLTFGTVTWGFPNDASESPAITRVNPFPTIHECLPVLDDVFSCLLKELCP